MLRSGCSTKSRSHFPYDSDNDSEILDDMDLDRHSRPTSSRSALNKADNDKPSSSSALKGKKTVQTLLPFTVNGMPIQEKVIKPQCSRKKTSIIWKFFKKSSSDPRFNVCQLCGHETSNSNTSNSRSHLQNDHGKVYRNFLKQNVVHSSPNSSENEKSDSDNDTDQKKVNKDVITDPAVKQLSIRKSLKRKRANYGDKSERKKSLDKELTKMICKCLLPFNIVEKNGFQKFISLLDERYALPCRQTIARSLLPNLYTEVQSKINGILNSKNGYMSITFDGWTSRSKDSYMSVTAHFISDDMKMCNFMLKLINCNDISHSAEDLSTVIRSDIINQVKGLVCFAAVTDCAANMLATASKLQLKHSPCIAHRMQSVIHSAMLKSIKNCNQNLTEMDFHELKSSIEKFDEEIDEDESSGSLNDSGTQTSVPVIRKSGPLSGSGTQTSVPVIIRKCKRITEAFNKSTKFSNALKKDLKKKNSTVTSLIQECPTRWNSSFFMLQRYYLVMDSVNVVLGRFEHNFKNLSLYEVSVIPDILRCLEPFQTATNDLSSLNYPSISLTVPTVKTLISELDESIKTCKTVVGKNFAEDLLNFTKSVLLQYEERTCSALACLLDPRFKKGGFSIQKNADNAALRLREEVKMLIEKEANRNMQMESTGPKIVNAAVSSKNKTTEIKGLMKLINKIMPTETNSSPERIGSSTATACIHVNEYLSENIIPDLEVCPLQYWKNHNSTYLREIAKKYLGIPATSVPSESTFSVAGDTVSSLRTRLSPERVDQIVYINKNIDSIEI